MAKSGTAKEVIKQFVGAGSPPPQETGNRAPIKGREEWNLQ